MVTIRLHNQPNLATQLVTGPSQETLYGSCGGKMSKKPKRPTSPKRGDPGCKRPKNPGRPRKMCGSKQYDMAYAGGSAYLRCSEGELDAFFRSGRVTRSGASMSSETDKSVKEEAAKIATTSSTARQFFDRMYAKVKYLLTPRAAAAVVLALGCIYYASSSKKMLEAVQEVAENAKEGSGEKVDDVKDVPVVKKAIHVLGSLMPDTKEERAEEVKEVQDDVQQMSQDPTVDNETADGIGLVTAILRSVLGGGVVAVFSLMISGLAATAAKRRRVEAARRRVEGVKDLQSVLKQNLHGPVTMRTAHNSKYTAEDTLRGLRAQAQRKAAIKGGATPAEMYHHIISGQQSPYEMKWKK